MPKSKKQSKSKKRQNDLEKHKAQLKLQLKDLGKKIYSDLDSQKFPTIHFPSRSVRNIVYDKKTKQYILGSKTVSRTASNIKHIRPFTQMTGWHFLLMN